MYLNTQDQVRNINWSRNYLWDIRFPDAPAPFNNWFPATDVTIDMGVITSESFEIFTTNFSLPIRTAERTMSITFIDDARHTLVDWLTYWMASIVSHGDNVPSGVQTLESAVKSVYIARLDNRHNALIVGNIVYIEAYGVYPDGKIQFLGSSDNGGVNSYTQNFIIAEVREQPWIENMRSKGKV